MSIEQKKLLLKAIETAKAIHAEAKQARKERDTAILEAQTKYALVFDKISKAHNDALKEVIAIQMSIQKTGTMIKPKKGVSDDSWMQMIRH